MAERKYQFERLTPTDNVDLDVYEDAINYVDARLFEIRNIDLPRKVKYRPRYKQPACTEIRTPFVKA